MVDMHSHVIPGVDDGSKSVEETFNMIKEAKEVGFTDVILTSHFLTHYYEPTVEEITLWKTKLQEIIDSKEMGINLHTGMEIYISNQLKELIAEKRILTLNDSRYMLIEFPLNSVASYWERTLYLLQSLNIKPIIAHPERYGYVQDNPDLAGEYIENGALLQCNYGSILELYGKRAKQTLKILLKKHQVSFLGTDCHRQNSIYTKIPKAVQKIEKLIGEDEFYKLSTVNPMKVLNNEEI